MRDEIPTSPLSDATPTRAAPGWIAALSRLLVLVILALLLVLPFTPFAGKIKGALKELIQAWKEERSQIQPAPPPPPPREIIKEVIKEVVKEVPAPPPPLPEAYIPRKEIDVATLYNGITVRTNLLTEQGTYASLERLDPEAYRAEFQLSIRVPKANQSLQELTRINPALPSVLPGLDAMLPTSKVSGFYHKLYENKTSGIQRNLTRLNRLLDRHNFFDCETILELSHPVSKRKALLIQSEMDVVADGSDGDRMPTLDEYIYLSDYYQPFTSYAWPKRSKTPNPLLKRWEARLKKAKDEYAIKGLSVQRNRELRALIEQLDLEVKDLKARSSLIAEKDPFIVISLLFRPYADTNPHTPKVGDYAVVIHEGKLYPAICGDYGPTQKMGEASLFMAKTINPKATPYRRPESDLKVTYLIFPGTAERPFGPPNLDHWHARCAEYLEEIGTPNAAAVLHRWEDPFKKPEPEPVATTTPETPPTTEPAAGAGDSSPKSDSSPSPATPPATPPPPSDSPAPAAPTTPIEPATTAPPASTPDKPGSAEPSTSPATPPAEPAKVSPPAQ